MTGLARRIARPEILALPPLDLAEANGQSTMIRLDSNENAYPPLVDGALAADVNRYPDPAARQLTRRMADLYGVETDNIVATRGADDAIDALVRSFCRAGDDAVLWCSPGFSQYARAAAVQGARVIDVPLADDFIVDEQAVVATVKADGGVRVVFLCSPNNPTGGVIDPAVVRRIAEQCPDTLIVLDEAYIEFAGIESFAREASSSDNLVVLRTLSKAYGLAGARVGALLGPRDVCDTVARVMPPYALPSLSIAAALVALAPASMAQHSERIDRIIVQRDAMAQRLVGAKGVTAVRNGGGNFLLVTVEDPDRLLARARAHGISVRARPQVAPGAIRISIGTPQENAALLALFDVGAARIARIGQSVRRTAETHIAVAIDLDAAAPRTIDTGIGFYDHMLDQIAAHGGFSLVLSCEGDIEIDPHHSVEDCAIAFGEALSDALGPRKGIGRFGFSLPMDEASAEVLIDLSGRPYLQFDGRFSASHIGDYPTEMTAHVFRSIAHSLGAAIHVRISGENDHHMTEACFKAFGRALRQAVRLERSDDGAAAVPSTKGVL